MKLYIARHGQTDWNTKHKAQSHTDIPLNETGMKQAEALRDNIKDIKFTAVYASLLKRAAKTDEIATDDKYDIVYDNCLMERSFGNYEGREVKG